MQFKVSKGLDIPISGNINSQNINAVSARNVALLGDDYHGLKPTMLVKEGNVVIKGQNLFEDKKNPGVKFTSPVSGKVVEINRGERRAFLSIVIEKNLNSTSEVSFESFKDASVIPKDLIIKNLIDSGLWTSFRTRPFSKIPKITDSAHEIFISLINSDPLNLDPELYLKHHIEDFNFGLKVISHIPKNCVHISTSIDNNLSKITSDKIRYHEFEGLHPVGLVGTQIHRISPVSINKTVWTINYQDVAMIGKLFKSGSIDTSRTVALCGPQVEDPCLVKTEIGASISEITSGNTLDGNNRFISGSVLCGREANSYTNYLGRYNAQVSVLREVEKEDREFLNFLRPGLQKHSVLPVFLTKLKEKLLKLNYTTAMNGADRAIVPIGIFEDIFPFNIMITQLLKSIVIGDTELAQKLGILELDEEDLALCTYACPSKYDYGSLLREMLTKIEEEG
tara:strand:+ start:2612 stop:3967 length:1356 start_codon:yes stop_codon:yes gene_type:complete